MPTHQPIRPPFAPETPTPGIHAHLTTDSSQPPSTTPLHLIHLPAQPPNPTLAALLPPSFCETLTHALRTQRHLTKTRRLATATTTAALAYEAALNHDLNSLRTHLTASTTFDLGAAHFYLEQRETLTALLDASRARRESIDRVLNTQIARTVESQAAALAPLQRAFVREGLLEPPCEGLDTPVRVRESRGEYGAYRLGAERGLNVSGGSTESDVTEPELTGQALSGSDDCTAGAQGEGQPRKTIWWRRLERRQRLGRE